MSYLKTSENEIKQILSARRDAVSISYSAGKDSTLLLIKMLNALEREREREIDVLFLDTGIEQEGITERVQKNFEGLNAYCKRVELNVKTHILKPDVKNRFFNIIVGRGYTAPYYPLRWCTSMLKKDVAIKHTGKRYGTSPFITITGERKDESFARLKRITKNNPNDDALFKQFDCRKNEYRWEPIRNVKTDELWRELERIKTFPWGETVDELLAQYNARSVDEVLSSKHERRSGCRFCTIGKGKHAGTNEAEREFCAWIFEYSKDINKRNLYIQSRLDFYRDNIKRNLYAQNGGVGKFTVEARREILERVRKMERETGRVWITPEDESFIYDQWEFDKGRIERRELIDAREVIKPTKTLFTDDE